MSRAFVKEDADAPEPPLPERPIGTAPNRVTPRGAALIGQSIATLKDELARVTDDDASARIRRDLRYWHSRQASMHVVASDPRRKLWVSVHALRFAAAGRKAQ